MPNQPAAPGGEIVLYRTEDGATRVECRFADETLWLTQALMAELFQTTPQNITLHLKALYAEGEIEKASTCKEYLQVRQEGERRVRRMVRHYSLDAILAVGYRVRSERGTQFRRWATERLREYLVKGFTMDDDRLKNPPVEGSGVPDYFDELLERIRDIRASERRMYLRVSVCDLFRGQEICRTEFTVTREAVGERHAHQFAAIPAEEPDRRIVPLRSTHAPRCLHGMRDDYAEA